MTGAVVGAGLLGGALYLAFGPERSPASGAPPAVASAAIEFPPAPEAPLSEARAMVPARESAPTASVAAPAAPLASSPVASAPRARDRLAEEVALLSRAMTALRTGRAAKAQALCTLGRTSEGRAELARLAPQSPAAARAKQVCDPGSGGGRR